MNPKPFRTVRREKGKRTPRKRVEGLFGPDCYWCGEPTVRFGPSHDPRRASSDHLIPRSMGGVGGPTVTACRDCNSRRGSDMTWVPWKAKTPEQQALGPGPNRELA